MAERRADLLVLDGLGYDHATRTRATRFLNVSALPAVTAAARVVAETRG